MPETVTEVEDKKFQRLLNGTGHPEVMLRNYSKPPKPELRPDHKFLLELMPHLGMRQAAYMVDAMQRDFIGVAEVDEIVRSCYLESWRKEKAVVKLREKQRLQKNDVINMNSFLQSSIFNLLRLILMLYRKLYSETSTTQIIDEGKTVVKYSYKE